MGYHRMYAPEHFSPWCIPSGCIVTYVYPMNAVYWPHTQWKRLRKIFWPMRGQLAHAWHLLWTVLGWQKCNNCIKKRLDRNKASVLCVWKRPLEFLSVSESFKSVNFSEEALVNMTFSRWANHSSRSKGLKLVDLGNKISPRKNNN